MLKSEETRKQLTEETGQGKWDNLVATVRCAFQLLLQLNQNVSTMNSLFSGGGERVSLKGH